MKKLILIAVLAITGSSLYAQQEALYTHYMYNTLAVNPGYAGTRGALTVTALHRSQWVGFEGAPNTQTLTIHSPLKNRQMGVGLSIVNDVIGPDRNTSLFADYSYKLKLNDRGAQLALGVKAGFSVLKSGLGSLETTHEGDPVFNSDVQSALLPNFGFGLYYYTERFYAGLSVPRLLDNDYTTNTISGNTDVLSGEKHYYMIIGANFNLSDNIKLRPTSLVRMSSSSPLVAELTALFVYNDKFSFGIMGRSGDAVGLLVGVNVLEQLEVGYSFDWSFINSTKSYNAGSHEIVLRYDFIYKTASRIQSPRYF